MRFLGGVSLVKRTRYLALQVTLLSSGGRANPLLIPKAIEDLHRCCELDPENAMLHFQLGVLYEELGQNEPAQLHLERFLKLGPTTDVSLRNEASALIRRISSPSPKRP